ncbi:hypothetical protein GII36_02725 [Candidatus Mycosynbacter amalyticus]|uniref:Uncharacterized protein n=1 Tax=Candidatus Mycosynbacter amalyticus TaxID=2665156 RepID=A0A857MTK8_9BACT|nr:hypothetical protein [Candidatus Mycosynbacter amalyticus]QHN42757.1 hypothetical protein GII36_02725 [Candidatus Mycosynbacter amalyticus]
MHTFLVILHVTTMVASMTLMSGAIGLGIFGKRQAVRAASYGMGATLVGFGSGLLLMLAAPLTLKCAMLTSYLLAVSVLYYAGYGAGNVAKARFVRQNN